MKIFWNFALFSLSLVFSFAMGEGLTRLWIEHRGDALHRARRVITANTMYGWRQRPLLKTKFEGAALFTDATGFRQLSPAPLTRADIVTIGPSSAFGWGVRADDTYTAISANSAGLIGFNAGQIGYSLTQGRLLYQELRHDGRIEDATIVIVSYGINDLDRFRFSGSDGSANEDDESYFARDFQADLRWEALATGSALLELLVRSKSELSAALTCGVAAPPALRLSLEKFRLSLQALIAEIRADGRAPILVNTPYRVHPTGAGDEADLAYRQSANERGLGHCREAREWILKARAAEPERVARDVVLLNQAVAAAGETTAVPVVDAYQLLGDDPGLFFDPIHPSAEGHRRIAASLTKAINETVDFNKTTTEPAE